MSEALVNYATGRARVELAGDGVEVDSEQLVAAVAEQFLGLGVGRHDVAGFVGDEEGVGHRLQEAAEAVVGERSLRGRGPYRAVTHGATRAPCSWTPA